MEWQGHCTSSEDFYEMPSSSSSSFLGLPLGFLLRVVVIFWVLAVPCFCSLVVRPEVF